MAINSFLKGFLPKKEGEDIPDLPNLLEEVINDMRGTLPPDAFRLLDAIEINGDKNLKDLKCQIKREAEVGEKTQCARGYRELAYRTDVQKTLLKSAPKELKTKPSIVKFGNRERGMTGKKSNLLKIRVNQNLDLSGSNYSEKIFRLVTGDSPFEKDFDPLNPDSTLGNKAILFDANGKVILTANGIAREGRAVDESAKLATTLPPRTQSAKKIKGKNIVKKEIINITKLIDQVKSTGRINSIAALFAAVTGMVAVLSVLALLVPLSFLTVALNWLQTVTTMLTNIKDVATTYLSVTDAGLSLFGYPKTTDKLKKFANNIAYGIFGKENYEQAKAAFAKGILNLTSLTKMLERVEAGRRGTDSKIDGVAYSLGVANNALKEGGVIPPDSPWSEYSEKVDKFVDAQAKVSTDPDLKENIQKLTTEIKTSEEIDQEIKAEADAKEKIRVQKQKEIDNLRSLGEGVKPIVEKQINDVKE